VGTEELCALKAEIQKLTFERNAARHLAAEVFGHTRCRCFQRRLPPSHWLFHCLEEKS